MNWLTESFKTFGEKIAIRHADKVFTYRDLYDEINHKEYWLRENRVNRGEVVSILSDYSFESISLLIALYNNKNIIVPITTTTKREVTEKLEESYSDKYIDVGEGDYKLSDLKVSRKHDIIRGLREIDNSGLILFSSGSTGKPKAMIHNFDALVDHYRGKKEKSVNMILFLMFDHIGGLNTLLNILSMGSTMVIPENRNADDICKLLQDYKIRILPASPTFLNLILMSRSHDKYDLSSLRMVTYGTEAMPDSLLHRLKTTFPKTKFLQTFGTSETGIANTLSKSSNSTYMKIDDPETEFKIVDNELWLKSKTQVMGYLNSSMDSFTEDGWFKTGDLVEQIEDGYIKIIGRNKEVINVGGEKVLPNEVESLILSMTEVEDVIVYGEQNAITGQTVVCDVVSSLDTKEMKKAIRKYCRDKIDPFKVPTKVRIVEKTSFGERFKKIRSVSS